MSSAFTPDPMRELANLLSRLPGLGPRSARRAMLFMLSRRQEFLEPLSDLLAHLRLHAGQCSQCRALAVSDPCPLCGDPARDASILCVVEETGDVWALERARSMNGLYHVLGGALSPMDHIGPDQLSVAPLLRRAAEERVREVIIATGATLNGQATAHYLAEKLKPCNVLVSRLARGVPAGGELDYMDDRTLAEAIAQRRAL